MVHREGMPGFLMREELAELVVVFFFMNLFLSSCRGAEHEH